MLSTGTRTCKLILRNRKLLPRGLFISEDFPEDWIDRRRILKPIFNAAKKSEVLKHKTYLKKDTLVIDGKVFRAGPTANVMEANELLDVAATCQRNDGNKIVFLGPHSVFSNLHPASFKVQM